MGSWQAGEGVVDEIMPPSKPAWVEQQRLRLLAAEASARAALGPDATLGEALSRLVLDAPKGAEGLVVVLDRVAASGLAERTAANEGSARGSRILGNRSASPTCRSPGGALLTTRDRAERWAIAIPSGGVLGSTLTANVRRAAEFGQDGSGRFVAVDAWLRTDVGDTRPAVDEARDLATWRPIDELDREGGVLLHRGRMRWTAILAAIIVFVAAAGIRLTVAAATFFRAVWIGLALAVLGLVVAPWALWELLLGPITSLGFFLIVAYVDVSRSIAKSRSAPSKEPIRAAKSTQKALRASLGCGLVLFVGGLVGRGVASQEPDPDARSIYVLGGTRAFVKPDFVRWLETAEREARPATADVVFLAADYQGAWDGQRGVFKVDFDVHASRAKSTLTIPLAGVDLLDGNFLDGKPAYPVVAPAGTVGYQVAIPSIGLHRLTMAFAVRSQAPGDLRFGIPQTPDANLRWTMPAAIGQLQTLRGSGAETSSAATLGERRAGPRPRSSGRDAASFICTGRPARPRRARGRCRCASSTSGTCGRGSDRLSACSRIGHPAR